MQGLTRVGGFMGCVLAIAGCAAHGPTTAVSEISANAPDSRYPIARNIRYGFTVQNATPRAIEKAEFWVYGPVRLTSTQRAARLSASQPYQLITDELGNQILRFEFRDLPPHGAKVVNIQAELYVSDTPNPAGGGGARRFTAPERYVESDAPEIAALARTLRKPSAPDTARNAYDWVAGNLKSETYIPDDRGALYALTNKIGDCTEFMDLFVALARANEIPARGVGGYVTAENAILRAADYHNWAEFHHDGTWRLADAQRRVFGHRPSQYIAMRIISEAAGSPLGDSHRFHYSGAGLKVSMN